MGVVCCGLEKIKQKEEEMQEDGYVRRENTTSARRPLRSFNTQVTFLRIFLKIECQFSMHN